MKIASGTLVVFLNGSECYMRKLSNDNKEKLWKELRRFMDTNHGSDVSYRIYR